MREPSEAFRGGARFHVLAYLGDGGSGVVYRAFDREAQREVALKVLRDAEGEAASGLRASFEALRALDHPNLVKLYGLCEEAGRLLLVMELIEGKDLLSYVRGPQGCDELKLRGALAQLAQGLCALHRARKVHRDVKSANVRVTAEGRVVLLDLDLAADADRTTAARGDDAPRPFGTALYMAPEQVTDRCARPASDWYGFGAVLYEALTGTLPFRGSDFEILMAKQEGHPPLPSVHVSTTPPDLERLCIDLLAADPKARPSGAQVLRRLGVQDDRLSGRLSFTSMLTGGAAFVGREPELGRLQQLFERSVGETVVVRVSGESGMGKTSLGEHFLRRVAADARGPLALFTSCPRYPDRPHAALHEPTARVVELLKREGSLRLPVSGGSLRLLERLFPFAVLGVEGRSGARVGLPIDPLEQRWRALSALQAVFATAATLRPLVLWIDNYQWADADTRRLVASLVYGEQTPRMMLVISDEPEAGGVPARDLAVSESIELGPLPEAAARTLVQLFGERAPGLGGAAERDLCRGGVPYAMQERLRHALFFGEPARDDASLADLLSRRLAELPAAARRVLELVCAAHDPLVQEVCERASGLSRAEFSRQLSALRVGAFVRSLSVGGEDWLVPFHPLVADRVDEELHGSARIAIHRALALALSAHDATRAPGRLLRHQGESADHVAAAESARVAAEEAHESLAFQRAAELLTLAASLDAPPADEAGYRLCRRMADALAHAGWSLQAATVYREAAVSAKAADALHMRQRAAEHLLRGAELEEGMDAISELLASVHVRLSRTANHALWSSAARRRLLDFRGLSFHEVEEGQISARDLRRVDVLWSSGMQLGSVDVVRGADFMTRALDEALKIGEPFRVARALCTEAATTAALDGAEIKRVQSLLEAARELVERLGSPLLDGHLRLAHGRVAFAGYRLPDCLAASRDAERVFRDNCDDVVWEISTAQIYQGIALMHMASYRDLAPKLELWKREAEERGDLWGRAYFQNIGAMSVLLARDRPQEAALEVREVLARWGTERHVHFQHFMALLAAGSVELYRGGAAALERLDAKWPLLKKSGLRRVRFARTAFTELRGRALVVAARRSGDLDMLRMAEHAARSLLREPTAVAKGFGHLLRANVFRERGQDGRAAQALELAIPYLEGRGVDQWLAPAKRELGRLLGGEGGRTLVQEAQRELEERGVRNHEHFVGMLLPAFTAR